MSYRNWIAAIALGLTVASSSLAEEVAGENPIESRAPQKGVTDQPAVNTKSRSARPVAPTEQTNSEHDGHHERHGDENPNGYSFWGDSVAQWVMAAAGLGALVVSIWAVVLLKRTLEATEKAVAKAGEGNRTAQRVAETTERIGKAQVRAYLSCEGGKFWLKKGMIWFEIYVSNKGQSPLFDGKCTGSISFMEPKRPLSHYPLGGGFGSLAAGSDGVMLLSLGYKVIDPDELERFVAGHGWAYFSATMKWKDVFGEEWWARYTISQDGQLKAEDVDGKSLQAGELRALCLDACREQR